MEQRERGNGSLFIKLAYVGLIGPPNLYDARKEGLLQSVANGRLWDLLILPDYVTERGCEFKSP